MIADVLILGCGYAGRRVARRLLARGVRVTATSRNPGSLAGSGVHAIDTSEAAKYSTPGCLVVHSIPPDGPRGILDGINEPPSRVVYISSTAVYGEARFVDADTPVDPADARAHARLEAEAEIARGPWSTLVLRPAAIYGPGRGVHESVRRGLYSPSENWVSRIHVDDLAAHVEAALFSEISGAFPVADEEPCPSMEIASFCARLLGVAIAERPPEPGARRPRADRRVDGSAIRRALGIELLYPSYRSGVPAAMEAERHDLV